MFINDKEAVMADPVAMESSRLRPTARKSTLKKVATHEEDNMRKPGRPSKGEAAAVARYRLQINLTEKGKRRLDALLTRVDADSAADAVRDALRVYDILTEEVIEKKNHLVIEDGETGELIKLRLW